MTRAGYALFTVVGSACLALGCSGATPRDQNFGTDAEADFEVPPFNPDAQSDGGLGGSIGTLTGAAGDTGALTGTAGDTGALTANTGGAGATAGAGGGAGATTGAGGGAGASSDSGSDAASDGGGP